MRILKFGLRPETTVIRVAAFGRSLAVDWQVPAGRPPTSVPVLVVWAEAEPGEGTEVTYAAVPTGVAPPEDGIYVGSAQTRAFGDPIVMHVCITAIAFLAIGLAVGYAYGSSAPRPAAIPTASPSSTERLGPTGSADPEPSTTAGMSGSRPTGAPLDGVTAPSASDSQEPADHGPASATVLRSALRDRARLGSGAPTPTAGVAPALTSGILAHMGAAPVPDSYAAIPWGPGVRVRICAAHCVTVVSADAGPTLAMQRAGRIADLSVALFERVCGLPASRGLCVGTIEGPMP